MIAIYFWELGVNQVARGTRAGARTAHDPRLNTAVQGRPHGCLSLIFF
jgi:hypothetical protein